MTQATNTTIRTFVAGALLALAASLSIDATAQEAKEDHARGATAQEMKAPQTAPDHRDRADKCQKKAAEYRQEAETHRKMLDDYSNKVARNPKDSSENPYIKKMRLHCEKYIRAAENLAREADEMAKYHTMRAKELEGK
jgi:hypothetical protein